MASRPMSLSWPQWHISISQALVAIILVNSTIAQETFTNAECRAVTTQMNACASRWDSIRTECTKRVTTNTIWPGPCECAYFSNDLPCFDEQEFCAAQVWTQVPQWFRDGVTSCLMKDASFTIKAQLGNDIGRMGNPFTVKGLAGNATRTADSAPTSTPAQTGAGVSLTPTAPAAQDEARSRDTDRLSPGAKAGFGVGIGVGVIMTFVMAVMIVRHRRRRLSLSSSSSSSSPSSSAYPDNEKGKPFDEGVQELHSNSARIYQAPGDVRDVRTEVEGRGVQRFELGVGRVAELEGGKG